MCCGTKGAEIQKLSDLLERPHSLSPSAHTICAPQRCLPQFLSYSLSFAIWSPILFMLPHSFLSVRLLCFDAGPGTLAWPFFPICIYIYIYILSLQQHKHTHTHTHWQTGMCGNLPLATSVTCIWSWWGAKEPTDPGENMQMAEAG